MQKQTRFSSQKFLQDLDHAREDFKRRTKFYPSAFLLEARDWKALGRRRHKQADVVVDFSITKRGMFRVLCGRAYTTWKFQELFRHSRNLRDAQ